ncbi:MAG TPA: OmpA family protein [Acidobacteriota bacterium]|nr:OmpA family protein [Acidobacteriota bacterium]
MIRTWMIATAIFLAGSLPGVAAEKYADPDAPAVHAAARQALKSAEILPLSGKVLDIMGVTRGISGLVKELGGKITATQVKLELAADVLFDFDKSDLRSEAVPTLQKVSQVIKNYPGTPVLIEGHTDSVGADDYNLKLSERRAQSVSVWLQKEGGIEAKRISTKGLGETKPVAQNTKRDGSDNPEGRQKNRRVEITIRTK